MVRSRGSCVKGPWCVRITAGALRPETRPPVRDRRGTVQLPRVQTHARQWPCHTPDRLDRGGGPSAQGNGSTLRRKELAAGTPPPPPPPPPPPCRGRVSSQGSSDVRDLLLPLTRLARSSWRPRTTTHMTGGCVDAGPNGAAVPASVAEIDQPNHSAGAVDRRGGRAADDGGESVWPQLGARSLPCARPHGRSVPGALDEHSQP